MSVVFPDVSEFQALLDGTYSRDFVSFRVAFGTGYRDPHFLGNAAVAKVLHDRGKLAGVLLYGVQIFSQGSAAKHFDFWRKLIGPKPPAWLAGIELDEETWDGASYAQHGDHSGEVNQLGHLVCDYMESKRGAVVYGNHGDLAELCPHRDPFPVNVASYGPQLAFHDVPHAIAQQYTNGQISGPAGLPLATAPFGNCDHNVFPGFTDGHALRAFLRPDGGAMNDKAIEALMDKKIQEAVTPLQQQIDLIHKRNGHRDERLNALEAEIGHPHPRPHHAAAAKTTEAAK